MRLIPALAKLAALALLAAAIVGLVAAFGTKFHVWTFVVGFRVLRFSVYLAIAGLVLGVGWLIASRIAGNRTAARWGWLGLIGSIAVLAVPLYNRYTLMTVPPIHDISTDVDNPPRFVAVLPLRKGAVNPPEWEGRKMLSWQGEKQTAAEVQKEYYSDIRTFAVLIPPAKLFARALEAANDMGWDIVAVDPRNGRIEATDTSFFFGFTDDIAMRVRPAGMGAKLDIRSKSRIGTSDGGENAARIRAYMKALADTD